MEQMEKQESGWSALQTPWILFLMTRRYIESAYSCIASELIPNFKRMKAPSTYKARRSNASVEGSVEIFFGSEFRAVHGKIDAFIGTVMKCDPVVVLMPEQTRLQQTHALSLAQKFGNDLLASLEMLRLGYIPAALSIFRTAMETQALSMLVSVDPQIFMWYAEGKFSSKDAVRRLTQKNELHMDKDDREQWIAAHRTLGDAVHPTINSTWVQFFTNGAFPLGSSCDPAKFPLYRTHLKNVGQIADNFTIMLRTRFLENRAKGKSGPQDAGQ